jgi:glycosyltransferase involved in cell wall biosynthesis
VRGEDAMIQGRKLVVVMPAYNAERTLVRTYQDLPLDVVDEVIIVDDGSRDGTVALASRLGERVTVIKHERNLGYGGNQKTCYSAALDRGADIVVMVHPDYQYSPRLCGAMAWMVASGEYDLVLASRILGRGAKEGRMPWWRYFANRALTAFENLLLGLKLSEFHTGYRAYSRDLLTALPLSANSDDFVFDNQLIAQAAYFGYRIGEISCPTRYMAEASSINFRRSVIYGFGVLGTAVAFRLQRWGLAGSRLFSRQVHVPLSAEGSPEEKSAVATGSEGGL